MATPNRITRILKVLAVAASIGAFACASAPVEVDQGSEAAQNEFANAPQWVLSGCSAYWGEDSAGTRVCGVGSSKVINGNFSMARTAAINRARAEISRSLEAKVKTMVTDYREQMTDGDDAMTAEQVTETTKTLSKTTLNGTTLQQTWVSSGNNLYTLVALDIEAFNKSVQEMGQLSSAMRKYIEGRAQKSFQEMQEEMDREYGDR